MRPFFVLGKYPLQVHRVLPSSPASLDGRARRGDRVLSINGRSTRGMGHKEAAEAIKVRQLGAKS